MTFSCFTQMRFPINGKNNYWENANSSIMILFIFSEKIAYYMQGKVESDLIG